MLYSTFAKRQEAISAAQALVEKKLIACANIYDGVVSVYRWEGKVQQEPEVVLMAKTRHETLPEAMSELKRLHSYEIPCITAWPIGEGFPPFLEWVMRETQ